MSFEQFINIICSLKLHENFFSAPFETNTYRSSKYLGTVSSHEAGLYQWTTVPPVTAGNQTLHAKYNLCVHLSRRSMSSSLQEGCGLKHARLRFSVRKLDYIDQPKRISIYKTRLKPGQRWRAPPEQLAFFIHAVARGAWQRSGNSSPIWLQASELR